MLLPLRRRGRCGRGLRGGGRGTGRLSNEVIKLTEFTRDARHLTRQRVEFFRESTDESPLGFRHGSYPARLRPGMDE